MLGLTGSPSQAERFRFEKLNRVFEQFLTEVRPLELGSATIRLSSPQHSLTIEDHAAELEPMGGALHAIRLELRFSGEGVLDADIEFGRIKSQLSDRLTVPSQTLVLEGLVELHQESDAFEIVLRQGPPDVTVVIRSDLAQRLFAICHQMVLVLVQMDCAALEEALSTITVPLPESGESFLLPRDELRAEELLRFELYLKKTEGL